MRIHHRQLRRNTAERKGGIEFPIQVQTDGCVVAVEILRNAGACGNGLIVFLARKAGIDPHFRDPPQRLRPARRKRRAMIAKSPVHGQNIGRRRVLTPQRCRRELSGARRQLDHRAAAGRTRDRDAGTCRLERGDKNLAFVGWNRSIGRCAGNRVDRSAQRQLLAERTMHCETGRRLDRLHPPARFLINQQRAVEFGIGNAGPEIVTAGLVEAIKILRSRRGFVACRRGHQKRGGDS